MSALGPLDRRRTALNGYKLPMQTQWQPIRQAQLRHRSLRHAAGFKNRHGGLFRWPVVGAAYDPTRLFVEVGGVGHDQVLLRDPAIAIGMLLQAVAAAGYYRVVAKDLCIHRRAALHQHRESGWLAGAALVPAGKFDLADARVALNRAAPGQVDLDFRPTAAAAGATRLCVAVDVKLVHQRHHVRLSGIAQADQARVFPGIAQVE